MWLVFALKDVRFCSHMQLNPSPKVRRSAKRFARKKKDNALTICFAFPILSVSSQLEIAGGSSSKKDCSDMNTPTTLFYANNDTCGGEPTPISDPYTTCSFSSLSNNYEKHFCINSLDGIFYGPGAFGVQAFLEPFECTTTNYYQMFPGERACVDQGNGVWRNQLCNGTHLVFYNCSDMDCSIDCNYNGSIPRTYSQKLNNNHPGPPI